MRVTLPKTAEMQVRLMATQHEHSNMGGIAPACPDLQSGSETPVRFVRVDALLTEDSSAPATSGKGLIAMDLVPGTASSDCLSALYISATSPGLPGGCQAAPRVPASRSR